MLGSDFHSQAVLAVSVLSSSFLGSAHCLGMCGPIVLMTNTNAVNSFFYHIGRLVSYLLLGLVAAVVGKSIIGQFPHSMAALIAPLTLGLSFIYMGIMLYRNQRFHLPLPKFLNKPYANAVGSLATNKGNSYWFSFLIGAFSLTLPCGWLYGFVIGASATENTTLSLMMMFMFWLGTIPALLITPVLFQKLVAPVKEKFPTVASVILLLAGLFIIVEVVQRTL